MPAGETTPESKSRSHTRHHTMWMGNVRNLPFEDQIRATAAVGLDEISMTPLDFERNVARGLSARDMRRIAADNGVSLPILDPLASWAPNWQSGISDAAWMEFLGYAPDDFFRIAGELEATVMTVIGTFNVGQAPIAQVTENFGAIADKAATHGLFCVLEFIPLWGVNDLATAWQIVRTVNRPNVGLAFDFWHYIRGGVDDALLRSIPGEKISYVQVTDAEATLPAGRTLFDDCLFHRLQPGEGALPVNHMLEMLKEIGGLQRIGPEVFSAKLDKMSADGIADALRAPYWRALETAGIKP